jgi:hypothetical protein
MTQTQPTAPVLQSPNDDQPHLSENETINSNDSKKRIIKPIEHHKRKKRQDTSNDSDTGISISQEKVEKIALVLPLHVL